METGSRTYIAIDLKSFYASVECVERGLDPLTTNLVVADTSRTEKTICLAVSPSLKAYGISGRARLFEVTSRLREVNAKRRQASPNRRLSGKSTDDTELRRHPDWEVNFIAATPRMAFYIDYSTRIYKTYLKYVSSDDIHVYSIDEVFIDATDYLRLYNCTAHELAMLMIRDVLRTTGITATAGIGTNLYLCKVAMDIVAKHMPADADGVRIAELDEKSYRRQLWDHQPLTDFWRIGRGISNRLQKTGVTTMGQLARRSLENENQLYDMFGVNAELIIDHAWGYEPCTIDLIKAYRPENNSFSSGQVLSSPYPFDRARIVVNEMADAAAMNLLKKRLVTDQITLSVGYDNKSLADDNGDYNGVVTTDYYGRNVPRPAHGTANLSGYTSSSTRIVNAVTDLYDSIVDRSLLIRRINISTNHVIHEDDKRAKAASAVQLDLFSDNKTQQNSNVNADDKKQRDLQETLIDIKRKYGKNAVLKGLSFVDGATARQRNSQIGGHKA